MWSDLHRQAEVAASNAEVLSRAGRTDDARNAYHEAALFEEQAFDTVEANKPRTLGILAISAASLWFKANELRQAELVALRAMSSQDIPSFAVQDLRTILQSVWTEDAKLQADVSFLPGQILVSVKGGEVVIGGAPLDLIVDKVKGVQAIFYRTIELMLGKPVRKRGAPSNEIQEACRPWLFQAAPGSYQFSVAVQEPAQPDFFQEDVKPNELVSQFLRIVEASASDEPGKLATVVPQPEYQSAFLKLTRNLAPRGKQFSLLELRTADNRAGISLGVGVQTHIKNSLRAMNEPTQTPAETQETIRGILRAVHLEHDWMEIVRDGESITIQGLQDSLDDVIGAMVNRTVIATTFNSGNKYRLGDVELEE